MTNYEPDPIPAPEMPPVGEDWLPRFSFSLKRLLVAFAAYAIALGAYAYYAREYVAYGLIPGTTMAMVVLLFRKQDLALLLNVGIGALFFGGLGGVIFGIATRVDQISSRAFNGFTLGALIGGMLGRWFYLQGRPKS